MKIEVNDIIVPEPPKEVTITMTLEEAQQLLYFIGMTSGDDRRIISNGYDSSPRYKSLSIKCKDWGTRLYDVLLPIEERKV